jgi:hypothetical protein
MRRIARLGMVSLTVVMVVLLGTQIFSVSPTLAATINNLYATCQFVGVRGKTEVNTSYVRVQVVLASDLTRVLAQQVVSTRSLAGSTYTALLDIHQAHLAEGTHIIISAGEWDGIKYLRPATLIGVDCNHNGGNQQLTPVPSPTLIVTQPATLPPTPVASFTPTLVVTQPPTPTPIKSPTFPPVSPTPPPTPTQPPR